jgi:hypothetical protein
MKIEMIGMSTCSQFYSHIAFKVGNGHIPFQFVYGLHPLLPTNYFLPTKPRLIYDPTPIRVLTSRLLELKKFQEKQLVTQALVASNKWN